jgi:uncharacterized protein (TIGR00661 family)
MKIFYAIQATGNGHIARAMELMPYLQQYGTVDVFLSGSNNSLSCDLPVKFRSKGLSLFYGNRGGLDYWKMWKALSIKRIISEAKQLPVENYDIVINDFESITALACKLKNIPSINFGHQASFQSKLVPRPSFKDPIGELILKYYAAASHYVGLHFEQYDSNIFSPIIKADIMSAVPKDKGFIAVYLSHYTDEVVFEAIKNIKDIPFKVFSKQVKQEVKKGHISFVPISTVGFNEALINCHGMITGAGFETPAEALYLGKKLMVLPIKGQYEQLCNAAALKRFDAPVIASITSHFEQTISHWLNESKQKPLNLTHHTYDTVQHVMELGRSLKKETIHTNLLSEEDLLVMG